MGNPLTVWFDDPEKEPICEEIADDLVLMKDRRGRVLGFERLNYLSNKQRGQGPNIPVEIQVVSFWRNRASRSHCDGHGV